jgi:hypothetical protein
MGVAGESIAEVWLWLNLSSDFRRIDSLPAAWYPYAVYMSFVLEVLAVFYCVAIRAIEVC